MHISVLVDRQLGLLGFGKEGAATLAALRQAGHAAEVLVFGDTPPPQLPTGCRFVPPEQAPVGFSALDAVVRSPGFAPRHPLRQMLDTTRCLQTTATCIFMAETRAADVTVIGVTASKGKSTISALVQACLQQAGLPSLLLGNIGQPALAVLEHVVNEKPLVVMELSSYQCADLEPGFGPPLAAIGSLFPEHLDYHGGYAGYLEAKTNIARSQRAEDVLVCHVQAWPELQAQGLRQQVEICNDTAGMHWENGWFMQGSMRLADDSGMRIPGLHNRANACIAFALARRHGVKAEQFQNVIREFSGLPYRLQAEGLHGGIHWINDSISTAPEASAAALEALAGQVHTLIVGGQDRGYNPLPLLQAIATHGVRAVIALPDTGIAIAEALQQMDKRVKVQVVPDLPQAVQTAVQLTPKGAVCLLSPGAPSYNLFTGFEARGGEFRRCIGAL
jgi:UDP-N-acetylmuramoylalanine--D-glutamate ligase